MPTYVFCDNGTVFFFKAFKLVFFLVVKGIVHNVYTKKSLGNLEHARGLRLKLHVIV